MRALKGYLAITALLGGIAALALPQPVQAQTAAARAPTAPGVIRAVEHPDQAVDQTQPDSHQPETAADPPSSGPETATDNPKPTPQQKAEDNAKQGVRSNAPPPPKPKD
jgi:hypothetical protein